MSRIMRTPSPRQSKLGHAAGFTIVESIITMLAVVILAVIAYSAYRRQSQMPAAPEKVPSKPPTESAVPKAP